MQETEHPIEDNRRCGEVVARNVVFLDEFLLSFATTLIVENKVAQRVRFLFSCNSIPVGVRTVFRESIRFEPAARYSPTDHDLRIHADQLSETDKKNRTVVLQDLRGHYRHLHLVLYDHSHFYEIASCDYLGGSKWLFSDSAILQPHELFFDLHHTRAMVNMIVWASNILGFHAKISP